MTSKEILLYDNNTSMNNALADIRANVAVERFFLRDYKAFGKSIADGECVLFDVVKNDILGGMVAVINLLAKSEYFSKLTKEQKEIVSWQWFYNKVMDYYDGLTKRRKG